MNQDKLDMIKQEKAKLNIDDLGISEPKWTGTDKFNSDDHYIYYCGQETLRRNEQPSQSAKESKLQHLGAISKIISVCVQGTPFKNKVTQVYAPITDDEESEVDWFYEDQQHLLELRPKKVLFSSQGNWNAKVQGEEITE